MKKIKTYCDACVLIGASRNDGSALIDLLFNEENRIYASSIFTKLEVLPKASYEKRQKEFSFYNAFFEEVEIWLHSDEESDLLNEALKIASTYGLAAFDALHVACALHLKCDELLTCEKKDKPIHRVKEPMLKIICVAPAVLT